MTTEPFKVLCSYAYYRTPAFEELLDSLHAGPTQVFGDSGAHSARTLGITITLEDYARWCHRHDPRLTLYANLDVIGAPEATWRNQKRLEQHHGLEPIPVFHTGEPWSYLERYLDEGYTYIALGKLLGNPIPDVLAWLEKVFRIADGRAVFHGFGMTVWRALRAFPFYSVDSSTWGGAVRYGALRLFDPAAGTWVSFKLRDRRAVLRHRDLVRSYGTDPLVLASRATYSRPQVAVLAARTWRRAEEYLRAHHGPVSIPEGPHNPVIRGAGRPHPPPGLHLYLADTFGGNLLDAAAGVHVLQQEARA